jgi:hypothetical protein
MMINNKMMDNDADSIDRYIPGIDVTGARFIVIDYVDGHVCMPREDYDVEKPRDGRVFIYPASVTPIICISLVGSVFSATFFNGVEWATVSIASIDTSDSIKARVFLTGKFFKSVIVKGIVTRVESRMVYDVYENPYFFSNVIHARLVEEKPLMITVTV